MLHRRRRRAGRTLLFARPPASPAAGILGYVGVWLLVDEAHICNIAVTPAQRGHGLGKLLLFAPSRPARSGAWTMASLEVRVSNVLTQNLYIQFGFEVVGRRRHYYSDNGEDALIMSTGLITSPAYHRRLEEIARELYERLDIRRKINQIAGIGTYSWAL